MLELQQPSIVALLKEYSQTGTVKGFSRMTTLRIGNPALREALVKSTYFNATPELDALRAVVLETITAGDMHWGFSALALRDEKALEKLGALQATEDGIWVAGCQYPFRFVLGAFIATLTCLNDPRLLCNRLQISQCLRTMKNVRKLLAAALLKSLQR